MYCLVKVNPLLTIFAILVLELVATIHTALESLGQCESFGADVVLNHTRPYDTLLPQSNCRKLVGPNRWLYQPTLPTKSFKRPGKFRHAKGCNNQTNFPASPQLKAPNSLRIRMNLFRPRDASRAGLGVRRPLLEDEKNKIVEKLNLRDCRASISDIAWSCHVCHGPPWWI